jgi:NADPH:quinone reductase-like Zn-dependent oxidoreductase
METQNMKAVLCTKYGEPEVLKMSEVTKPFPKHNEVCIKIHATAVTMSDIFIRSSDLPLRYKIPMRLVLGIRKPRRAILGLVLAGVVESTGKENDSTYGCVALMPKNVSFEEAGSLAYGGLLALQYIEHGNIKKGDHVAIYGASSNSGTLAIQLANNFGAHVTAICSSKNHKLVKELGADVVMDYQVQDEIPAGVQFDFVLDAVGNIKTSKLKEACKKALVSDGKYTSIDDGDLKLVAHRLDKIREFTEAGVLKAILDRTYPLDEIVEAHRYVQNGHKKGGVAISVL